MNNSSIGFLSLQKKIFTGETTCEEITRSYLKRIHDHAHLNAFLKVFNKEALIQAKTVDDKISQGNAGKLAGMIVAVKDILAMKGTPTTCGSKILENFISPYDATVIQRLKDEDAILIGKTNMDEFGMGSSTENSAFGSVKNPYDESRIPGGSSGGSAVAVAADLAMTALGTDTGGSVRQPASHCGVIGLRPTYGRVSRYGLIAFASSLDQVGIFSKTAEDCAHVLNVISGHDSRDATCTDAAVPDYYDLFNEDVQGLRVGLPKEYFQEGLNKDIRTQIDKVVTLLVDNGAEVIEISLSLTDHAIATYYLICTAEASSNLARYDGIRYGLRKDQGAGLGSMYEETRNQGFGSEVKRRIMLGTYVLSAGYYDAYYRKAQKVRTLIRNEYDQAFKKCDLILGATSPSTAFHLGEKMSDPLEMYLTDIYTVSAPLAGIPAISIPIGKDHQNMPIGMQLTAPAYREDLLLKTTYSLQQLQEMRVEY
ncbi:Asp-tRNA(Asn)/Glu-tRNA(Gln) amidotransferase subunit GatA [bacterium]